MIISMDVLADGTQSAIATNPPVPIKYARRCLQATARYLSSDDRHALGLWVGAHVALAVLAWICAWIRGERGLYNPLLGIYGQWDFDWYWGIAAHGYFSGHSPSPVGIVFLPGEPIALALVHLVVRNWVIAGLLVSLMAGGVAIVCVVRLGGRGAALHLITAPAAMYLIVGYSESLFLALALPAWMAAKRRNWPLAGLLAAFAGLVRANGLFLIAALLTAALTARRGEKLRAAAWTSIGLIGPALYELYMRVGRGSWTAWLSANRTGWGLRFVGPFKSLANTWHMAFGPDLPPNRAAMFQIEIACMFVGVALTIVLLCRRAWPEAVYVGLTFIALGTTSYYQSVPRALLVCWPLYLLIARAADRRPWIGQLYLWVSVPLAVIIAVYFFLGYWGI